ncbi:hypothetical protein MRX96_031728 [Rhipicephalus microplus]|uniref:DDE Tnp4 domain-containing protein n=1 Tax=Rhipicephalus microplus TaxID=6941 RepID=A0A9J6DRY3_RHIMP|nr:hypothetical protein HPB51_001967 [Rhipicephalus microplus]
MERQKKIAALKLLVILKRRRAFLIKYWVRPTWANRAGESEFFTAMKEMKNGDESLFYTFYWMSPATFDVRHSLVKEKLTKDQCRSREPISSGELLALTLRYLSSVMLVRDAAMAFRVGIETAWNIIHETCTVLWEVLSPEHMKGTLQQKSVFFYRRCVENAYGILVSHWRTYERQINLEPENMETVVRATCVLHNFLSSNAASTYCPPGYVDFQDTFGNVSGGAWRQGPGSTTVFGLEKPKARNCSKVANAERQVFVKYFNEESQVPWQWKLPGVAPRQP